MALVFKDRVKETTTTSGTGTITLAGAVSGFQTFSVIGDGNTTYYTIVSGTDWEVGIGTYTLSGTTLSRDTILESSNGGSAISLSGTSTVFCTYAAEKSVYRNSNDQINVTASGLIFSNSTVQTTAAAVSGDNVSIFVNDAGYITGTGNANQVAIFDTTTSVSGAQGIEIETTGDPGLDIFRKSGQTTTLVNIYTESTGILTAIDENGYIGIGTGDPTYHLQVEGTGDFDTIRFSDGSLQTTSASGAVIGPASSTDNAIARFDGTTGKLIQDTAGATIDDNNILSAEGVRITAGGPTNWMGFDTVRIQNVTNASPQQLKFQGHAVSGTNQSFHNNMFMARLSNVESSEPHGSAYLFFRDNVSNTWEVIQVAERDGLNAGDNETPTLVVQGTTPNDAVMVGLKGAGGGDIIQVHMQSYRIDDVQNDGDTMSMFPEFIFSNTKSVAQTGIRKIFPTQDGQSSGYYFGLGTTNPTEALYVADKAYIQSSYSAVTDSTDGGSLTLDFDTANVFNVALTGNVTSVTFSNANAGQKVLINVKQDSAGGYTITGGDWSATKWTDNTAPTLSTASGTVDTIGIMVPRASTYYGYICGTGIIDV